jgi:hypothetical protein
MSFLSRTHGKTTRRWVSLNVFIQCPFNVLHKKVGVFQCLTRRWVSFNVLSAGSTGLGIVRT